LKAVILCAGYGKRMKPYTDTYQKTMLPLHGKPLLEYVINGIALAGIQEFIIVVGYRKEQIIDYFKDGKNWDVSIEYIEQKELDGTGGALLLCENSLKQEAFFLTWGDTLAAYNIYREVYEAYKNDEENFILVTNYVDDPYRGAAIYCEGNYCLDIIEKPPKGTSSSKLNNTGIFILSNEIFEVLKTQGLFCQRLTCRVWPYAGSTHLLEGQIHKDSYQSNKLGLLDIHLLPVLLTVE